MIWWSHFTIISLQNHQQNNYLHLLLHRGSIFIQPRIQQMIILLSLQQHVDHSFLFRFSLKQFLARFRILSNTVNFSSYIQLISYLNLGQAINLISWYNLKTEFGSWKRAQSPRLHAATKHNVRLEPIDWRATKAMLVRFNPKTDLRRYRKRRSQIEPRQYHFWYTMIIWSFSVIRLSSSHLHGKLQEVCFMFSCNKRYFESIPSTLIKDSYESTSVYLQLNMHVAVLAGKTVAKHTRS